MATQYNNFAYESPAAAYKSNEINKLSDVASNDEASSQRNRASLPSKDMLTDTAIQIPQQIEEQIPQDMEE